MKILVFSDLHRDKVAARSLVERSGEADILIGAGDFAVMRHGVDDVIRILKEVDKPTVLVPGNGESDVELREACTGWASAHVLHGEGVELEGVPFYGIGGGIPVTPFGEWSFDLTEAEADVMLTGCPNDGVLISHSPPYGHVDEAGGRHLGSHAVLDAIERATPRLVVCGHIHQDLVLEWQGRRLLATPSTCVQFKPHCTNFTIDDVSPGWRYLDLLPDGRVETQVFRLENDDFRPDMDSDGY